MNSTKLLCTAIISAIAACAEGAPSRMRPVEVISPDGDSVTVVAVGDEHHHWFEYADGKKVMWLKEVVSQKLTPAMKHRSNAAITESASTDNEPQPHRITNFPTIGEEPFLVILVEFSNKGFAFANPLEEFDAMLNLPGYNRYNGNGSVADYFIDNSDGQFQPHFDVVGPVKMAHDYAYYGSGSDDSAAGLMVIEACRALDDSIDFSDYDLDGDGAVDNIYFYYAGKGEADGGDSGTIWPHSWNLADQGRELTLDGVSINAYACSPELDGESKPNGIGTFCHEFSHVLGLPDLYSSSYSDALHPATWSLMASGNYNDDGRTPPGLSSYERLELNWLQPKELSYPLSVELQPLVNSNRACKIATERNNEYFLLENRQLISWDSSLPGHGMLIWHIDYNPNIWDRNVVNQTASHQYVDIVEANNATSHNQDSGFTFPGSKGVTSFTSETSPALKSWSGQSIDVPITSITETSDRTIKFDACGGKTPVGPVLNLTVKDIQMESCRLEWDEAVMADSYSILITDEDNRLTVDTSTNQNYADITGLWPGKIYTATVRATDQYESGEAAQATIEMPAPTFEYLRVNAKEPENITRNSFEAIWDPLSEADSYLVTVNQLMVSETSQAVYGFDNKQLPDGWTSEGASWGSIAGYYGESAPALRLSRDGASLTTSTYSDDILSVSMFLRASSYTAGSRLIISGSTDSEGSNPSSESVYTDIAALELSAQPATVSYAQIPPFVKSLRFTLDRQDNTALSIDDIQLSFGRHYESELTDWADRNVGDALKADVDNLEQELTYTYRVTALSGERQSLPSETIIVTTRNTSALNRIEEPSFTADLQNLHQDAIFSLDGRRITDPRAIAPGLYIIVSNGIVHKIRF